MSVVGSRSIRRLLASTAIAVVGGAALAVAQQEPVAPVETTLARVGEYVEQYYARARSILVEEEVVLQPLTSGLVPDGFPRRVLNELRVEWNPSSDGGAAAVDVVRRQIKASGPSIFAEEEKECGDPPSITPEPLSFLLPGNRDEVQFTPAKKGRVEGRPAIATDYRERTPSPILVNRDGPCMYVDLSGRTTGRLWTDADTSEILRHESHLIGMVDVRVPREKQRSGQPIRITYERNDMSTSYRRMPFRDPDEQVLLPDRIDQIMVYRTVQSYDPAEHVSRLRMTQTFRNYRRYVTGGRIVQ
jgi:hypothetical protein